MNFLKKKILDILQCIKCEKIHECIDIFMYHDKHIANMMVNKCIEQAQ